MPASQIASSVGSFTLTPGHLSQAATFAIPAGTYLAGQWVLNSSGSATVSALCNGSTTSAVQTSSAQLYIPLNSTQLAGINAAAGGNLAVTFSIPSGFESVTAAYLQISYADVGTITIPYWYAGWYPTGLSVTAGQAFHFDASSYYVTSTTANQTCFPEGTYSDSSTTHSIGDPGLYLGTSSGDPTNQVNYPSLSRRTGSLVVEVSSTQPQPLDANSIQACTTTRSPSITAPATGRVWLAANEGMVFNDAGPGFQIANLAVETVATAQLINNSNLWFPPYCVRDQAI